MAQDLPLVPLPLYEWLTKTFPNVIPAEGQPDLLAEVHRKQGEQRVIRKLASVIRAHEEQSREASVTT